MLGELKEEKKLTIKAKKIWRESDGEHISYDQSELERLLRDHFNAEVVVVNENGDAVSTINTKDFLAAMAFSRLQWPDSDQL